MPPERFPAYRIHADKRFGSGRIEHMDRAELDAGGSTFEGSVLPLILRGIRLLGVNVNNPVETKLHIWRRLASDLKPRHLERIVRRIALDALPRAFDDLLAARVRGRQVVDFELG